ncbi:MAG TPA: hypothetical protein DD412_00175 [Holosporales bacterium]|nr:hypothetical protein [Holosporales bacterium]
MQAMRLHRYIIGMIVIILFKAIALEYTAKKVVKVGNYLDDRIIDKMRCKDVHFKHLNVLGFVVTYRDITYICIGLFIGLVSLGIKLKI